VTLVTKYIPELIKKILFISIFLWPQILFSQNIGTTKSDWSITASAEGLYQSRNTSKLYVNGRNELKRADGFFESILTVSLGYGESRGRKDANDFYAAFTYGSFL